MYVNNKFYAWEALRFNITVYLPFLRAVHICPVVLETVEGKHKIIKNLLCFEV